MKWAIQYQNIKFLILRKRNKLYYTVSKGLSPPVLAQRWENDLETRSDMSIKGKRKLHDMRIIGVDCESAKRVAIRVIK